MSRAVAKAGEVQHQAQPNDAEWRYMPKRDSQLHLPSRDCRLLGGVREEQRSPRASRQTRAWTPWSSYRRGWCRSRGQSCRRPGTARLATWTGGRRRMMRVGWPAKRMCAWAHRAGERGRADRVGIFWLGQVIQPSADILQYPSPMETHFELVPRAKRRPPSGERHSEAIPYGLADDPPTGAVKSTLHSTDSGLIRREAFLRKSQSLTAL